MKRRRITRLMLHRETLRTLDSSQLRDARGALIETGKSVCFSCGGCLPHDEGGTGSLWCNTGGVCSDGCATGGACTT